MVSEGQLSRHTVEHRISNINTTTESQLHSDLQACEHFSVALDESYDIQDKPQLVNICTICVKRLCDQRRTSGYCAIKRQNPRHRCERNMAVFAKANLPIQKLTAIATDGEPAMASHGRT